MERSRHQISLDQSEYRVTLSKVAMTGLLIAVIPIWPYVFYQFLKIVIFGTAVFSAYLYNKEKDKKWMWIMIVIAVIFNPINPLYFGHFLWSIVDIVVALLFFKSPKLHTTQST